MSAVSLTIGALLLGVLISGGTGAILYIWNKEKKNRAYIKSFERPTSQEVKKTDIKGKVEYVIENQKDERTVIAKRGKISPKKGFLDARIEGVKRRYYPNHIIQETQGKRTRNYVRWNAYYSEAYNLQGKIVYDPALENQLMNDMENQLGKAVGAAVGFVLERPMLYIMGIAFLVAMPIGFNFPNIFPGWAPNTVIHWVPRA